jgi:hypothetical protein
MYPTQKEYHRIRRRERTKRDIKIVIIALIVGFLIGIIL